MAFFKHLGDQLQHAADHLVQEASHIGLDIAGAATNIVAPSLAYAGHAIAGGACHVADAVTMGKIDVLHQAKEEQFTQMEQAASNVEAGMAHLRGVKEPWYRGDPQDMGAWMQHIPDDKPVFELFIPGTHDSAANTGGDLAECQHLHIEEQLCMGIRSFDIRLKHSNDDLCCYHGIVDMNREFQSVVEAFENFLQQHPSECILARISESGTTPEGDHCREFVDEVRSRFRDQEKWHVPDAWPTMGQARGKILLIHSKLGKCYDIDLQDAWEIGDHQQKLDVVLGHGQKERSYGVLNVNYCSSTGMCGMSYITPSGIAYHVNKGVMDNMHSLGPGLYMLDFPGPELVQRIVERNHS